MRLISRKAAKVYLLTFSLEENHIRTHNLPIGSSTNWNENCEGREYKVRTLDSIKQLQGLLANTIAW